jgi:DNA-binding HxlR family transcriptional regulator
MLTKTLRSLERDKLLTRKVYPVVPPKTEYQPTPLGRWLLEPITGLSEWAKRHESDLKAIYARRKKQLLLGD